MAKSEIRELITLSKDLCVYNESIGESIRSSKNYTEAHRIIMNAYDKQFAEPKKTANIVRTSSGIRFAA